MSLSKIKVQKTAQNLIGHFDPKAKIKAENVDDAWKIEIDSEISPMLIGRHGQNLQAIEHLLRIIVANQSEEFVPLSLDISGYKAAREQEITEIARDIAQRVIDSGAEESLPSMNSYERRLVHMTLAEISGIETASEGEEPYRKIVVRRQKDN